MSDFITIKKNAFAYRDDEGEYKDFDLVSDKSAQEKINQINTAASSAMTNIEQKGKETRDSIPPTYTEITDQVSELKDENAKQDERLDELESRPVIDKSLTRRVENLEAAAQGYLYREDVDSEEAYEKAVADDVLPWGTLDKVGAKTLVWNQIAERVGANSVQYLDNISYEGTGCSFSVKTLINSADAYSIKWKFPITDTHKYYVSVTAKTSNQNVTAFRIEFAGLGASTTSTENVLETADINSNGKYSTIVSGYKLNTYTSGNAMMYCKFYQPNTFVIGDTVEMKDMIVVDLTQMFGAGNEPTAEQFRALFPADYYDYCEPELRSFNSKEVVSIGLNKISFDDIIAVSTKHTLKDDELTFEPNLNLNLYTKGVLIEPVDRITYSYQVKNGTGTNFRFRFFYEDGYAQDSQAVGTGTDWVTIRNTTSSIHGKILAIGMNWSTYGSWTIKNLMFTKWEHDKFPEYRPYFERTTSLSALVSKYFPDGMHSAGDVHDEIDLERGVAIQRVGSVDLGTINWNYNSNDRFFWISQMLVPADMKYSGVNVAENWVCAEYEYKGSGATGVLATAADMSMYNYNDAAYTKPIVRCKNSAFTSGNAFMISMSGVMLYYELGNPIETPIDPADLAELTALNVEAGGSLTFANQHGDDYRVPLPNQETFMVKLGGATNV